MDRIGPYEILGEIGRGGAGVVLRARAPSGREVAVKLLLGARSADEVARRRFSREIDALRRVHHPNVIRILDSGMQADVPYLVMEYIEAESLQDHLDKRGALEPRHAAELALDLARALHHLHGLGILHRDVKPANVLLCGDGAPMLTDFGLVKHVDSDEAKLSQTGMLLGSPGYWAPEQARGTLQDVGPTTDVYGLGATLYAALTREPPIKGENLVEVLMATEHQDPDPPSDSNPEVDGRLDAICLRCLAKDPADRYRDAEALGQDLEEYLLADAPRRGVGYVAGGLVACGVAGLVVTLAAWGFSERPGPALDAPLTVRELTQRAHDKRDQGDLAGALDDNLEAIRIDPSDAQAVHDRGRTRQLLEDQAGALADYERAIELDPAFALAYFHRGGIRHDQGDLQSALTDYGRALELDPSNPAPYNNRGNIKQGLGDLPGALLDYERALELDPRSAEVYFNRGNAWQELGNLNKAVADFSRAIELDPSHLGAYHNRGYAKMTLKDSRGALADFTQTIELDPTYAKAYSNRGALKLRLGNNRGALADFDVSIGLDPSIGNAYKARGLAKRNLGRHADAAIDFEEYLHLTPPDPHALAVMRAYIRQYLGRDSRY